MRAVGCHWRDGRRRACRFDPWRQAAARRPGRHPPLPDGRDAIARCPPQPPALAAAEYQDIRLRLMRPCSFLGAACMVAFLLAFDPAAIGVAAAAVVLMRVANRVAGLMYGALLRDTSSLPRPDVEAAGAAAGRPCRDGAAAGGEGLPGGAGGDGRLHPDGAGSEVLAAHELAARGTAVGYGGMLAYSLAAGALFLVPAMLLPSEPGAARPGGGNTTAAAAGDVGPRPLGADFWLEQLLPIAGIGLFWAAGAALVTFPHLGIAEPGPELPAWVTAGSRCGPRPSRSGCCAAAGACLWEPRPRPAQSSAAGSLVSESAPGDPTAGAAGGDAVPSKRQPGQSGCVASVWTAARLARFGGSVGLSDQARAIAMTAGLPGRDLLWYLVSWMFLSDAASTATSSAALLVADELGVSSLELAGLAVVGMVAAGSGAVGWKRLVERRVLTATSALHAAILVLSAVLGWVAVMSQRWELYALTVIAGVQLGAIASFTRSLLVGMTPKDQQTRVGSLYELTQKGTSWIGPLAIGAALQAFGEEHYRLIVVVTVAVEVAVGWPLFALLVDAERGAAAASEHWRQSRALPPSPGTDELTESPLSVVPRATAAG